MSVRQEYSMKSKMFVVVGACLLTASVTWLMAKWTYKHRESPNSPPFNLWKIACITIAIIWTTNKFGKGTRWMKRMIRNLESIQNASFHVPPNESCNNAKGPKKGFNQGGPKQRAIDTTLDY